MSHVHILLMTVEKFGTTCLFISLVGCRDYDHQCFLQPDLCIPSYRVCDGVLDCQDGFGTDELIDCYSRGEAQHTI